MAQYTGLVMGFNTAKGFGFLRREGGPDVFCYFTASVHEGFKSLEEGEVVSYDVIQGTQGLQANDGRRVARSLPRNATMLSASLLAPGQAPGQAPSMEMQTASVLEPQEGFDV